MTNLRQNIRLIQKWCFFPIFFVSILCPVWQKMSVTQSSARHQRQRPVTRILCGQAWEGRHCVIPDPSVVLRSPIILFFSVSQMLQFALCAQNYNSSTAIKLTTLLFLKLLVGTLRYETVVVPQPVKEKKNRIKMLVTDKWDPSKAHWKQQAGKHKLRDSTPQSWGLAKSMHTLQAALSSGNIVVWGFRLHSQTRFADSPNHHHHCKQTHRGLFIIYYLFISARGDRSSLLLVILVKRCGLFITERDFGNPTH